ncbi:MAG: helix-turn-helix transcriptional regulator [Phycisphaerae bacterium]|nr:helix-turn-helix transcriptional regulator [Phycisphaerae bacterium]
MKRNQPPPALAELAAALAAAPRFEIDGVTYRVIRDDALAALARRAGLEEDRSNKQSHADQAEPDLFAALGPRLRDRRRQRGWTQAQLAARAGIRVETINRIEKGHNTPDFATIRKIAAALRQDQPEPSAPRPESRSARRPTRSHR